MTAMTAMHSNGFNCCSSAAVSTSAHNIPLLDTAIILAVSICILSLGLLRIIGPIA